MTEFGVVAVTREGHRKVIAVCESPGWASIIRDSLRIHAIKELRYEAAVLPEKEGTE